MYFDLSALPSEALDKLLHSTIVPRPIAWVSTLAPGGTGNLAPFSFFNVFSTNPPILGIGIGPRASGEPKDTARNIADTREFVVNIVGYENRVAMNVTGTDSEPETDESELAGLEMVASVKVKPRRVAASAVSLECVLDRAVPLGNGRTLFLGGVVAMHVDDAMIEDADRFYIDTPKLDTIGRMHGSGWYARTTDFFQLKRV